MTVRFSWLYKNVEIVLSVVHNSTGPHLNRNKIKLAHATRIDMLPFVTARATKSSLRHKFDLPNIFLMFAERLHIIRVHELISITSQNINYTPKLYTRSLSVVCCEGHVTGSRDPKYMDAFMT